jgi:Asp-tRNA(Asn)/Glu-tRNA(Gln) amidotransferase A subunit family amidase
MPFLAFGKPLLGLAAGIVVSVALIGCDDDSGFMSLAPTAASVGSLTVKAIQSGLAAGDFSCEDLIGAYLDRIEAYDHRGPALNAVITVNANALSEAADLDASKDHSQRAYCIPVVVKDVINTAAITTTYGSALFGTWVPEQDATIVDKLQAAGAIVLAKTNLDDFAAAVYGISSLAGAMKNPYDLTRTVGGSSGGSAAAIAAGYAPLAFGTDTGGSLRIPAAMNGVVTIRPTLGLVSRHGIFPRALTQDTAGPLASDVEDAAFGLDLIAGSDSSDPATAGSDAQIPADGYVSHAQGGHLDGMRIGLVTTGLALWGDDPDGPVVALLEKAAEELTALGAEVVPMDAPPEDLLGSPSVITYESAHDVDDFLSEQGNNLPVSTFAALYASDSYTSYAAEAFDREIQVDPDTLDHNESYQNALAARTVLQDWTTSAMNTHHLDAIAYASVAQLAFPIAKEQAGVFTRWSENTGFPAISLPMGYAVSDTGTSLPANIEFLAQPFSEAKLIAIADAYEDATQLRTPPPLPAIDGGD